MSSSSNPASRHNAIEEEGEFAAEFSLISLGKALPSTQLTIQSGKQKAAADLSTNLQASRQASTTHLGEGPFKILAPPSSATNQVPPNQSSEDELNAGKVDQFPFNEIPFLAKESFCAFGIVYHERKPSVGGITCNPIDWCAKVNVNAGRTECPQLVLSIYVAKQPSSQEFKTSPHNHDLCDFLGRWLISSMRAVSWSIKISASNPMANGFGVLNWRSDRSRSWRNPHSKQKPMKYGPFLPAFALLKCSTLRILLRRPNSQKESLRN